MTHTEKDALISSALSADVPAAAGDTLKVPVGIVTRGVDNQKDIRSNLTSSYLPHEAFSVRAVKPSAAAGVQDIKEHWRGSGFVMAATASQLTTFLEAMASLQERKTIKGWILVLDESDALQS